VLDEFGIDKYPFGKDGVVSLHTKARDKATTEPRIKVNSNVPFELKLVWEGGSKIINVKATKG
jgi:hypothetical protein